MTVLGAAEGLLFDLFRIVRKNTCKSFLAVGVSDIIYWLLAAFLFAAAVINFTDGELRGYIFIGIALGLIFYFLAFSRMIIIIFMTFISIILKIFKLIFKILLTPVKILYKMLVRPFIRFLKKLFLSIKNSILRIKRFDNIFYRWKPRKKNDKKTQ